MSYKVKDGLRDIAPRGQTRNSRGYHVERPKYYDTSVLRCYEIAFENRYSAQLERQIPKVFINNSYLEFEEETVRESKRWSTNTYLLLLRRQIFFPIAWNVHYSA